MLDTEEIKRISNHIDRVNFLANKHDWYVMKVIPDVDGEGTEAHCFPWAGSLEDCKEYIRKAQSARKNQYTKPGLLTWVPSEWVEEYLFGTVSYLS